MRLDGKFIKDQTIKPEKFDTDGYAPSAAGDLITLGYFQANGSSVRVENDGAPLTLRNKLNLYSGISAADDLANSRTNLSLGGTLSKDAIIDSGNYSFEILKNAASMKFKTETAFALAGNGADGSGAAYGLRELNGNIIIGGDFSEWNGVSIGYTAKLSKTGTFNTTFNTNIGTGFDSDVICLDVTPGNKIIYGGYFSEFDGTPCNGLFALNEDGTPYTAFNTNIGTSMGSGNYASAVAVDTINNRIYIAGWCNTGFNGNATYKHFVALNMDGTVDTAFMTNLGTGFQNETTFVFVQADGKVIVGGYFTSVNGVTNNRLVRLNADGTLDTAFNTNLGTGSPGNLNAVAQQSDGRLIIATNGSNTFNGVSLSKGNLFRLNTDGTFDAAFYANLGTGFTRFGSPTNDVYGLAVDTDNDKILVSGSFDVADGHTGYLVRLNSNGTWDISYGGGILSDGVYSNYGNPIFIDYTDGKKIYIGTYGNIDADQNIYPSIIRFAYAGPVNTTESASSTVNTLTIAGVPMAYESDLSTSYSPRSLVDKAYVLSQAETASNGLYRAGLEFGLGGDLKDFTTIDAKDNILTLKSVAPGIVINSRRADRPRGFNIDGFTGNGIICRTYRLPDGNYILAGSWSEGWGGTTGGTSWTNIVKVDQYGRLIQEFNAAGLNLAFGQINDVGVQSDGKIIIAGAFSSVNGNPAGNIARLNSDGTYDNTFSTGGVGFNKQVFQIQIDGNDEIFCAGDFETFNGVATPGIRKLQANGANQTTFNVNGGLAFGGGGNGWGSQVTLLSGGKILVAGAFNYYAGVFSAGIVRIDATTGARDATFVSPLGDGERCWCFDIDLTESKIVMGRSNSGRLLITDYNGAVDPSFVVGSGINWAIVPFATGVHSVKFTPDGQSFFVTGQFDSYKGVDYSIGGTGGKLFKIDVNGDINTEWTDAMGIGLTSAPNQNLSSSLQFTPDEKLMVTVGYNTGFKYRDDLGGQSYMINSQTPAVVVLTPNKGNMVAGSIEIRNTPLYYGSDYTDLFDQYSLVHKKYVDDAIIAAGGVSAGNGLTYSLGVVKLGGELSENTTIAGGFNTLTLGTPSSPMYQTTIRTGLSASHYTEIGMFTGGAGTFITTQLPAGGYASGVKNLIQVNTADGFSSGFDLGVGSFGISANAPSGAQVSIYADLIGGAAGTDYQIIMSATGQIVIDSYTTSAFGAVGGGLNIRRKTFLGDPTVGFGTQLQFELSTSDDDTTITGAGIAYVASVLPLATFEGHMDFKVHNTGTATKVLELNKNGAFYSADYSSNYTARSLVDKAYVDSVAGGGGSATASNGLTKVVDDIQLGGPLTSSVTISGIAAAHALYLGGYDPADYLSEFVVGADYIYIFSTSSVDLFGTSPNLINTAIAFGATYTVDEDFGTDISMTVPKISLNKKVGPAERSVVGNALQLKNQLPGTADTGEHALAGFGIKMGFDLWWGVTSDTRLTGAGISYVLDNPVVGSVEGHFEFDVLVASAPVTVLNLNKNGLRYEADYSANFTVRSLVDKGYVDGLVGGAAVTASNGLTKTGNDIALGGEITSDVLITGDGFIFQFGEIPVTPLDDKWYGQFFISMDPDYNNYGNQFLYEARYSDGTNIDTTKIFGDTDFIELERDRSTVASGRMSVHHTSIVMSMRNISDQYTEFVIRESKSMEWKFRNGGSTTVGMNFDETAALYYLGDYSANFTARSLVDKDYVDNLISSGAKTFENGLTDAAGVVKLGGALTEDTTISGLFNLVIGAQNHTITLNNGLGMDFQLDAGGYGFNFAGNDPTSGFDVEVGSIGVRMTATDNGVDTNGILSFNAQKTSTNTIATVANFQRSTAGTPANGIGAQVLITTRNASNAQRSLSLQHQLTNAAAGAEDSMFAVRGYLNGTLTDFLKIEATTTLTSTFYGVAQYNADYSANYTVRSLVDKGYVDGAITAGINSLVYPAVVTQNITGAVSIDLSLGNTFHLTLTGNVTSFTFTNEVVGRTYIFYFLQNTSYKTLAFTAGKFRFSGGTVPTLTDPTTNGTSGPARSVDIMSMSCQVAGRLDVVPTRDMIEN